MVRNTKLGFTLVELLVAMTIVMVLTVVGIVNYGSAQKSARDAKRKSDLEKIRIALEMAKQDHNGCYPSSVNPLDDAGGYLDKIPVDPKVGGNYCFPFTGDPCTYDAVGPVLGNTAYELYAHMEVAKNRTGTYAGVPCTDPLTGINIDIDANYKVTNP